MPNNADIAKQARDLIHKIAQSFELPHDMKLPENPEPPKPEVPTEGELAPLGRDPETEMILKVDGDEYEVDDVSVGGLLPMLSTTGPHEFYIAQDSDQAGEAAKALWQERIDSEPDEFVTMIGAERLIKWAMGQSDEFGMSSLRDFLSSVANNPAEELASYDSNESDASISKAIADKLQIPCKNGWAEVLAYRVN